MNSEMKKVFKMTGSARYRYPFFLVVFLIMYISPLHAGIFGYDSYDECFTKERQERLDRWISPMDVGEATVAARGACHEYYEKERPEREERQRAWESSKFRKFHSYYGGKCSHAAFQDRVCTQAQYLEWYEQGMK